MKFTYRWGQQPLPGYTIKRGLGKGGFGEVYFALSGGGKEVALKLINQHTDIELRGTANCLNLKHPNLVHLYDLCTDGKGDRWLVMEYVYGEPLNNIIARSPTGLPEMQVREWFLQAARAVAYLHDHAVIHRDIKPANLFVENGLVKLGDYGLSKSVGASHHSKSNTVGTINYMAPEIANGTYTKQVDVYACGVMLYEMLTGEVPFGGETWMEVALKHQTDLPEMRKIPTAYVPIIEKAMNKRAEQRFTSMSEFIRAVEAVRAVNEPAQPVSTQPVPRPPSIKPPKPVPLPVPKLMAKRVPAIPVPLVAGPGFRTRILELCQSMATSAFVSLPLTGIWAVVSRSVDWPALGTIYLAMTAVSWSVLLATKIWESKKNALPPRILLGVMGMAIGFMTYWLEGNTLPARAVEDVVIPPGESLSLGGAVRSPTGMFELLVGEIVFFGLALFGMRWWRFAVRRREEPFSLFPVLATAFFGMILLLGWRIATNHMEINVSDTAGQSWGYRHGYLLLILSGAAAAIQLSSPWTPRTTRNPDQPRYRRRYVESGE